MKYGKGMRGMEGARDQSVSIHVDLSTTRLIEVWSLFPRQITIKLVRRVHSFTVVNDCVIRSRIGARCCRWYSIKVMILCILYQVIM